MVLNADRRTVAGEKIQTEGRAENADVIRVTANRDQDGHFFPGFDLLPIAGSVSIAAKEQISGYGIVDATALALFSRRKNWMLC